MEERSASVNSFTSLAVASEVKAGEASGSNALRSVRFGLLALWLGAAVFFSFAVAPTAFAVLRGLGVPNANHAAGSIVTRTLTVVNLSGFLISVLLILSAFMLGRLKSVRAFYAEIISLAVIAITTGVGHWIINARLFALRMAMGRPIDEVAQSDPLRVAFNSLHGYSVVLMSVGMIACVVALTLIARRRAG
ncbi:MAG: DUF4149 domain-containing protein [Pyrinomonadaceae bacterium]